MINIPTIRPMISPAMQPVRRRSILQRFTRRDVLFIAALGYIAGTWIGIHLALV